MVILAVTRVGLLDTRRLRRSRRYAPAAAKPPLRAGGAVVGVLLPGDEITMLLETVPLYLLFEVSVLVAVLAERRARRPDRSVALGS